jgi:predicted metalloenzyme YecM
MERTLCNPIILKEVAQELGLPLETVKIMVNCQSAYTALIMAEGSFDCIRLPYLGAFKSKPKEVQMLEHLKGMTPEQQKEFKHAVRTRKIKLFEWDKKNKSTSGGTTKVSAVSAPQQPQSGPKHPI